VSGIAVSPREFARISGDATMRFACRANSRELRTDDPNARTPTRSRMLDIFQKHRIIIVCPSCPPPSASIETIAKDGSSSKLAIAAVCTFYIIYYIDTVYMVRIYVQLLDRFNWQSTKCRIKRN